MNKRIEINPKIMVGKSVIKGTRITVEHVLNLLSQGVAVEEIISEKYYPHLKKAVVTDVERHLDRIRDRIFSDAKRVGGWEAYVNNLQKGLRFSK